MVRSGPASVRSLESAPKRDGNGSLPVQNVDPNWHSHMASHIGLALQGRRCCQREVGGGIMWKGVFP